jgi:hypothetical protein
MASVPIDWQSAGSREFAEYLHARFPDGVPDPPKADYLPTADDLEYDPRLAPKRLAEAHMYIRLWREWKAQQD